MTDKPEYFDTKLPRSEAQILTFDSGRRMKNNGEKSEPRSRPVPNRPNHGCTRHVFYWEQAGSKALAGLVIR